MGPDPGLLRADIGHTHKYHLIIGIAVLLTSLFLQDPIPMIPLGLHYLLSNGTSKHWFDTHALDHIIFRKGLAVPCFH